MTEEIVMKEAEGKLPEDMTPEELEGYWKELFRYFANPKCKLCNGTGNIGTNTKTRRLIPCPKKRCAEVNLKNHMIKERLKKRNEEKEEE